MNRLTAIARLRRPLVLAVVPRPAASQERASQVAMSDFAPFVGEWRAETTEGPITCSWTLVHQRTVAVRECHRADDPEGEALFVDQVMCHPHEERLVFRRFEYMNPDDLLFDGWYRFESATEMERRYLGYYGDGSAGYYRQTYSLQQDGSMLALTYSMSGRRWKQIFDGLRYERVPEGGRDAPRTEAELSARGSDHGGAHPGGLCDDGAGPFQRSDTRSGVRRLAPLVRAPARGARVLGR